MGNNKLIIDERQREVGNFLVGRLLPFRKKRQVGPFVFIDHMGPSPIGPGQYSDVDQHPHIGLSTLTYLFEGEIEHKDSTGAEQVVRAGDVGFMSAGKGVTHTERTPQHQRDGAQYILHGYQVWVAQPKKLEESDPHFQYHEALELPQWETEDLRFTLVAGEGFGRQSPLEVFSPLFMVDIRSKTKEGRINIAGELQGEIAVVVVKGKVLVDGECMEQGQMLVSQTENSCCLELDEQAQLLLFGGQPFPEERFLMWNFASSDKAKLEEAKAKWIAKDFPKVPGDDTYISFPS
ncbi:pirin family protein [Aureicoccus marinus]|uniref:Pirin n=1 Tax=Aureicoccus marinus TaxID=754435 RepID=A0A2S7TAH9_9FLAO|nr:pirin family protein [Aureicoccus marinus]PQJ16535.1 hypothetical protein BST99_13135 [Aureicoccus marinus]